MATLKKTGNQQTEILNTTLQITPLTDIFSKERIKSLGFPEDLSIVQIITESLKTLKSPDGTLLAESNTVIGKEAKIISQESLDLYFEKGIPFKSFRFEKNEHSYHPYIVPKDSLEKAQKIGAFKTEDDKKIYGGFIPLHNDKKLENIPELKSGAYEIVAFIKAPYRSISENIIKVSENEFIGKAKHIYGTSYFNSDKYDLEKALPELVKQKNVALIRDNVRHFKNPDDYFAVPGKTDDFSGILSETPHYNQNEANDLMEVSCYFLPPSDLIKAGIEWVKPENDSKKFAGSELCHLVDDFQNDPEYKGKFKYISVEDVILVKHLGLFPFNKFEERITSEPEPENKSSLKSFM